VSAVLRLLPYLCRDSISILRVLLSMALQGKLRGLAICYRTDEGVEESVFTGLYKSNPQNAAEASLRLSIKLMQANGELKTP
jgi:hypothetical protein